MKSYNKLIIGLAIGISLVGIGTQSCLAAATCKSGTVDEVGIKPEVVTAVASPYVVRFTCSDATWASNGSRQYVIAKDFDTAMYATALTAIASGKSVSAVVASKTANSLLTKLTIVNP